MLHLLKGNYFNSCELFLFRFLMMNAWSKTLIASLQNMREKHTINRSSALWQLWSVQNISYILWGPFTGVKWNKCLSLLSPLPSPLSPPPSHAFFWLIIILKSPLIGPYEMTQAGPDNAIRPYAQPREMWHRATKKTNKLVAIWVRTGCKEKIFGSCSWIQTLSPIFTRSAKSTNYGQVSESFREVCGSLN